MVALLLRYLDDWEDAYWCLFKIMMAYNWREFFTDGMARCVSVMEQLEDMLKAKFPALCEDFTMMDFCGVVNSIAANLVMSAFTCKVPLNIATKCFEYFLFCQNGEKSLLCLVETILSRMQEKMLKMDSDERVVYIKDGCFVIDCFRCEEDWPAIFK
jgi:hypothetical protein